MKISNEQIIEALKDRKVICWSDLLIKLELLPLFEKYQKKYNNKYNVTNIYMGKTLMNWIDEIFKARIIKSNDKRVKYSTDKYKLQLLSFDSLQSMPKQAEEDIDYILLKDLF